MNNVLGWFKSNVLIGVCAAVAIAGIAMLFSANAYGSKTLLGKSSKRTTVLKKINDLTTTSISLPAKAPGDPPVKVSGTIRQIDIDLLAQINSKIKQQSERVFEGTFQRNIYGVGKQGHTPMLKGLFPVSSTTGSRLNAKEVYRQAFVEMLGPFATDSHYPTLNSGAPLDLFDLQYRVDDFVDQHLAGFGLDDVGELGLAEQRELAQLLRAQVMGALIDAARSIHIYSIQPNVTESLFTFDSPFDIGQWSDVENQMPPTIRQVWEGQLGLWIQQDIVEAITRVNRVNDPNSNVITAPIKQLKRIRVIPGYVGINVDEDMIEEDFLRDLDQAKKQLAAAAIPGSPFGMSKHRISRTRPNIHGRGGTAAMAVKPPVKKSEDEPLDEDFSVAHTGRRGNASYDVRHVRVLVDIDAQRIPEFFAALADVNYMTVLRVQIKDVDEYDRLYEGYIYGTQDVVELDLKIESIWLRRWTKQYMPYVVQSEIGMLDAEDDNYVDPLDARSNSNKFGKF